MFKNVLERKRNTILLSKADMRLIRHIPNLITCLNLVSGVIGIIESFKGNLKGASLAILAACIFDFFDGFAARLLKVSSPIGKELDSLADMVTFGVLPGLILFHLTALSPPYYLHTTHLFLLAPPGHMAYLTFLVPVFSALRLAKFNIDTRQSYGFIGVPTPANAILVSSLPFIFAQILLEHPLSYQFIPLICVVIAVVMSFLLVSEIPLMAFKFKNFNWTENRVKYLFILIALTLIIIFKFTAVPIIIFLYIFVSLLNKSNSKV